MNSGPAVPGDSGSLDASSSGCPRALKMDLTRRAEKIFAGVRKAVEAFALAAGLAPAAIADLGLAVNEALANVIRHAYQGRARRADFRVGRLRPVASHG